MQLANIRKIYEKNENNATIKAFLSSEDTKLLLHAAPQAYKTQINDILLTALMLAYGDLTGEYTLYFDLEGHGREHITENLDLSQTVGWFTSVFPVFLSLENVDDLSTVIKYVKEQLRQIPAHGIGFGILRFLSKEKNNFDSIREPDIIFNYLGQLDNTVIKGRLLKNAVESYGSCSHPKNKHSYSLEISAQIKNGIFEIWYNDGSERMWTVSTICPQ